MMNCGYTLEVSIIPIAHINESYYAPWPYSQPIPGLPIQFIVSANDTNASRIILGPVGKQFIGMTKFSCYFCVSPHPVIPTAVLTVLG